MRTAFLRLADFDHLHPVRLFVQLVPVLDELVVGGELVVVADVEAEELLRRSEGGSPGLRRRHRYRRGGQRDDERHRANTSNVHRSSSTTREADTVSDHRELTGAPIG